MNKKPTDVNRHRLAGGRYEPTTYNLVFLGAITVELLRITKTGQRI